MSRGVVVVASVVALLLVTQFFLGHYEKHRRTGRTGGAPAIMRSRPGRYLSLASLAFAHSAFVIWVVVTIKHGTGAANGGGLLLASGLVTAGLATGFWCMAAEFRERIRVDVSGIDWVAPLSHRHVPWGQVERIAYNPGHKWFFVTLRDGTHMWISDDLVGIGDFAELALAWLPPTSLYADPWARQALEELAVIPVPVPVEPRRRR